MCGNECGNKCLFPLEELSLQGRDVMPRRAADEARRAEEEQREREEAERERREAEERERQEAEARARREQEAKRPKPPPPDVKPPTGALGGTGTGGGDRDGKQPGWVWAAGVGTLALVIAVSVFYEGDPPPVTGNVTSTTEETDSGPASSEVAEAEGEPALQNASLSTRCPLARSGCAN